MISTCNTDCTVDPVTTTDSALIGVREGESVNITCFSFGVPTPTISWMFNGQTLFNQTSESSEFTVEFYGGTPSLFFYQSGNVTSTLQLMNVQYPFFGTYMCTGSNNPAAMSTATIAVEVLGMLYNNQSSS